MQQKSPRYSLGLALFAVLAAQPSLAQFNTNLIANAGAEAAPGGDGGSSFVGNLPGWAVSGEMMAIAYSLGCPVGYPCTAPTNPGPAGPGSNHFAGGNVVSSTATQVVDIAFASGALASGGVNFRLSGWLGGYASQSDNISLSLTWLNPVGSPVGTTTVGPVTADDRGGVTGLLFREVGGLVPSASVSARMVLTATRVGSGTANDGYADNLALVLSPVPEPATVVLLGGGLLGLCARRLHRR